MKNIIASAALAKNVKLKKSTFDTQPTLVRDYVAAAAVTLNKINV